MTTADDTTPSSSASGPHTEASGLRCACGQALPPDASWCWLCQEAVPAERSRFGAQSGVPGRAPVPAPRSQPWANGPRVGRLTRSEITFGPVGRVVCTVLVLLPIPWLLFSLFFGLLGALIYIILFVPWALRDIWRRHL